MTPIDKVLSKLTNVKKTGERQWTACCPAHKDRNPSLSITEGEDGRVLLHCFAGCSLEDILRAIGLEKKDLYPADAPRRTSGGRRSNSPPATRSPKKATGKAYATLDDAVAAAGGRRGDPANVWTYRNAQGDPVGAVVRWDLPDRKKDIRPIARDGDEWRIGAMPEPRPLYGLPVLAGAERVFVCEGEKAADAARSLGLTATTSPGGAQAATKADWQPLAGKDVVILPDNDEPGANYAADVVSMLATLDPAPRVKVVALPDLPKGGDIVEWIEAFGNAAEPQTMRDELMKLVDAAPEYDPAAERWPELDPFAPDEPPAFPIDALPEVLKDFVLDLSTETQTPPDLAGLAVLGVCGGALAKRVEVQCPTWIEPGNLFVATVLGPGNRKSAVLKAATAPVHELERERQDAARPEVARAENALKRLEEQLKTARAKEAKGTHEGKSSDDLAVELDEFKRTMSHLPRLVVDDATEEALVRVLAEQGGRVMSITDEGNVFALMAGKYASNGGTAMTTYLKAWDGSDLKTDRIGRASVFVENPALTCIYSVQPQVLKQLGENPDFRGCGLVARFLWAVPKSLIGNRNVAPPAMRGVVAEEYSQLVRRLFEVEGGHLSFDEAARAEFQQWCGELEAMKAEGGPLERFHDWGGKLAGATARIAGILHFAGMDRPTRDPFDHDSPPAAPSLVIGAETVLNAISIARYLIPHAIAAYRLMDAVTDQKDSDARWVLGWIERKKLTEFSRRDVHREGNRFDTVEDVDPALQELQERGYIRELPAAAKAGAGRPASQRYEVNPAIWPKGERPTGSHPEANE